MGVTEQMSAWASEYTELLYTEGLIKKRRKQETRLQYWESIREPICLILTILLFISILELVHDYKGFIYYSIKLMKFNQSRFIIILKDFRCIK